MAIHPIPKVVSELPILKELLACTMLLSGTVVQKHEVARAMEIGQKTMDLIQEDIAKCEANHQPRPHSPAKKFTKIIQNNFELINDVCGTESQAVVPPELVAVAGKISCSHTLYNPRKIGEGSFGILRLHQYPQAFDLVTKEPKADQDGLHQKELKNFYSIKYHDNIIKFFGVNHLGHILLEYADGGNLKAWTLKVHQHPQTMPCGQIRFLAQGILSGISYLNQTCLIAHRDIKPENVFLKKTYFRPIPKIGDLGLACRLKDSQEGSPAKYNIAGTAEFLAPEYFYEPYTGSSSPQAVVSDKVDPWAFGHMLYFMISNSLFFESIGYAHNTYNTCKNVFYGHGSEDRMRQVSLDINERIQSLKKEHSDQLKHIEIIHQLLRKSLVIDPSKRLNAQELLRECKTS